MNPSKTLHRQLKKARLSVENPPDLEGWRLFLERVDKSYRDADNDRYLLERSIDLSSREMKNLYRDLERASASKVAAERDKLSAVIVALSEGLVTIDRQGLVQSLNPAAGRLLGEDERGMLGRPILDRVRLHDNAADWTPATILAHLMHGDSLRDEDAWLTPTSGEPIPVSRIEFYVLAELIGARGKVLSRDHLLRKVWGRCGQRRWQPAPAANTT